MDYVISRYVCLFVSSENKYLVYSSRSNSFLEVEPDLYDFISRCRCNSLLIEQLEEDVFQFLNERKIVVQNNEDNDYILELQYQTNSITYSQSSLGLVIAPTIECNFACYYCFEENKRVVKMTDRTIDNLMSFIIDHKNAKALKVTWYGGEPLLAVDVIRKVLSRISSDSSIKLCEHNIITNGYYIDDEIIELFKQYPLNMIQITLDGNKKRHDGIRKDKITGEASYDRILKNIGVILDKLPDTEVHVRVNIDKNNINDFYELIEDLGKRWSSKKIHIYPGVLRIDNEDRTDLACHAIQRADMGKLLLDLKEKGLYDVDLYPHSFDKVCSATNINSYVIGPLGEIYKCWNDVSDDRKIIGYIDKKELTNKRLFYQYTVGCKWHEDERCRKCFFLPICSGACAWYVLRNRYEGGKYNLCSLYKSPEMLKRCLELQYRQKMSLKMK